VVNVLMSGRGSEGGGWPAVVSAADHDPAVLSRATSRGTLRRLARGIYTGDVARDPVEVVRSHIWSITAALFPGAVLVDRSAVTGGIPSDGGLFVDHRRQRPVELPGATIWPRRGPGPQAGDLELPEGIWLSSPARALLDNLVGPNGRARVRRTLERAEVEEWIDRIVRLDGESKLNDLREQARGLAPILGRTREVPVLDGLVSSALTTGDASLVSPVLRARAAGHPYDPLRVRMFEALAETLDRRAPTIVPALPGDAGRRRLLPFYEAYFSNFIEGTEFPIDEAAGIVFDDVVPKGRPVDAHDITGTYQLVADPIEMRRAPRDPDDFLDVLRARHALLLEARPDKLPGRFKDRDNRAGSTEFVANDLVEGTLRAGLDTAARVEGAFARAAFMMFLVTEVHPFLDGNGRIARVMMNAELSAAGESRIIVPTVYRTNYLLALKGATHNGHFDGMLAMLAFAQRFTARIDFTDRGRAEAELTRTNAFRDAVEADNAGVHLLLP
jgi:hypothetical protein